MFGPADQPPIIVPLLELDFPQEGEIVFLPADTVVLAVGAQSESKLAQELKGLVPEVYSIGDCKKPRDAASATYSAARVVETI